MAGQTIGEKRHYDRLEEVSSLCEQEDLELIESEDDHYEYIVRDMDGYNVCSGSLAEIQETILRMIETGTF